MAKNFRFHQGQNMQGWSSSQPLNELAVSEIIDPDGANAEREITSIPSPFARISLVKNAFKEVVNSGNNLDGKTIYHKMVSHALDIGELFFNFDKYKNFLEIITWDPNVELKNLTSSSDSAHKLLGDTLRLYIDQDKSNNLKKINRLYLLNYTGGLGMINIIGGTSPASLFFTSANDFNIQNIKIEGKEVLSDVYRPLHQRDPAFIKYLFSLKYTIPNFSNDFPEIDNYLIESFNKLTDVDLKNDINNNSKSNYNSLTDLSIDGGGLIVEVLGTNLKKAQSGSANISTTSDFRINARNPIDGVPPLVLPNEAITGEWIYINSDWNPNDKAPSVDNRPIDQRTLPFDGTQYPYLTVSDFLEPVIIRTKHPINTNYFVDAGAGEGKGYLLPIKPLFFDYFPLDFLNQSINGHKVFEIKRIGDNVDVNLRIPTQNGKFIVFNRKYYNPVNEYQQPNYSEEENKGAVIENRINLGVSPFFEFPDNAPAEYNVMFYDADVAELNSLFSGIQYDIEFYKSGHKIDAVNKTQRRFKSDYNFDGFSYIVNSNFDFISLDNGYAKGILIPKLKKGLGGGVNQFSFAIDFGTTNTHVEYKIGNGLPQPLEFDQNEMHHIGLLINEVAEPYIEVAKDDLLPPLIGKGQKYNFPQRTVAAYHNQTNFNQPIFSMGNVAIPFKYEKESFDQFTDVKTNLKWSADGNAEVVMKAFFEQLIKMIRNKVLLNNGNLSATKILWTYPASMTTYELNRMESQWATVVNTYLGENIVVDKICESLTPFYYYARTMGINPDVITIDIGGGTSDIAVYEDEQPVLFSSYHFAGDAIFGDNYNRSHLINGYVKKYYPLIKEKLEQNDLKLQSSVLDEIYEDTHVTSNNIINALFEIESNLEVQKKKINISLLNELKNDEKLKIIFLVFFSAQIYHLAKLMQAKDLKFPDTIIFSGTASKLLTILDDSTHKNTLSGLAKAIIERVNGAPIHNIKLELSKEPKVLTAKGGVYIQDGMPNLNDIREVYISDGVLISKTSISYNQISNYESAILTDYSSFLQMFHDLNQNFSYRDHFGIDNDLTDVVLQFLNNKVKSAWKLGVNNRLQTVNDPSLIVSEPLFFYPLVGSLGDLANYLVSQN